MIAGRPYLAASELLAAVRKLPGVRERECAIPAFELGDAHAPVVSVLLAGIHALEWIGVASGLCTLERLVDRLSGGRRVLAFPIVNIHGYRRVERDLLEGRRRFRRGNANGVDLNRNFPTAFRGKTLLSTVLPFVYAPGPQALSEPETAAIDLALVGEVSRGVRIDRAVSLHSIGEKVLYPYGHRWAPAAEVARLRAAAKEVAKDLGGYHAVQSSRWVPGAFAHGMEIDHLHDAYGATALLVEIGKGAARPWAPHRFLSPFDVFNPRNPEPTASRVGTAIARFLAG